jgi:hypothetical protein
MAIEVRLLRCCGSYPKWGHIAQHFGDVPLQSISYDVGRKFETRGRRQRVGMTTLLLHFETKFDPIKETLLHGESSAKFPRVTKQLNKLVKMLYLYHICTVDSWKGNE